MQTLPALIEHSALIAATLSAPLVYSVFLVGVAGVSKGVTAKDAFEILTGPAFVAIYTVIGLIGIVSIAGGAVGFGLEAIRSKFLINPHDLMLESNLVFWGAGVMVWGMIELFKRLRPMVADLIRPS